MVTPAARREAVTHLKMRHGFTERRACRVIVVSRRRINYRSRKNDDALRIAMRRIAAERRRFGYKRLAIMLMARRAHSQFEEDIPGLPGGRADGEAQERS